MLRPRGADHRAVRGRDLQPGSRVWSEVALEWLWVVAWVALIQTFTGDSVSSNETSRFLGPALRWLFPGADAESVAIVNYVIRKTGHFVEYAILALLTLRALRSSFNRPLAWLAAASLALALAVAVIDEFRQAAAEDRTGALSDVALDIAGAASALAFALTGASRRMRSTPA